MESTLGSVLARAEANEFNRLEVDFWHCACSSVSSVPESVPVAKPKKDALAQQSCLTTCFDGTAPKEHTYRDCSSSKDKMWSAKVNGTAGHRSTEIDPRLRPDRLPPEEPTSFRAYRTVREPATRQRRHRHSEPFVPLAPTFPRKHPGRRILKHAPEFFRRHVALDHREIRRRAVNHYVRQECREISQSFLRRVVPQHFSRHANQFCRVRGLESRQKEWNRTYPRKLPLGKGSVDK